jgi:hypothetical protein
MRGVKTHLVCAALTDVGKVYRDLTGYLPYVSSRSNQYVLVLYDYAGNNISTEEMKSRHEKETTRAYSKFHQQLVGAGLKHELQIMDN